MKKIALVTGGSGGIGEAICRKLYSEGYYILVGYCSSKTNALKIAEEICGTAVKIDVSSSTEVYSVISDITNDYGNIDLLVNNSGVSAIELFTHISPEKSHEILMTNLCGTMNCSRAVLPAMINQKSGCIINISSIWGQCGASCEVDYSASKAGIIGFTMALAKEVGLSGIRVNCVSPGFILTKMNNGFSEEELNLIKEEIPLGFFGKPEHVADAVAFLASDKAEFITGQNLAVNGGMYI